jgi:hypothetical protein
MLRVVHKDKELWDSVTFIAPDVGETAVHLEHSEERITLIFDFLRKEGEKQELHMVNASSEVLRIECTNWDQPFPVTLKGLAEVGDLGGRKLFLLSYVLWLPALGWCACVATCRTQKLALLVAAGILCPVAAYTGGNWQGSWILYMLQFAVVATLLLVPHVSLPRPVIPALMLVSAASYHIYLFHRIVPEILGLDGLGPPGMMASVAVGIASGIAAMALQRRVDQGSDPTRGSRDPIGPKHKQEFEERAQGARSRDRP